jgi:hypothetical protein
MKSDTKIIGFVGANPGDRPPPDLRSIPVSTDSNFTFVFCLAFARDGNHDGRFTPYWDSSITTDLIVQLQAENPNRRFIASLGGDNFDWQAPADEKTWLVNAYESLSDMKDQYRLDGFDLDYENNITDPSFVRVLENLIQQMNDYPVFPPRFQTSFSVTPFGTTYGVYQQMYLDDTSYIPAFNYQTYAEDFTTVQQYLDFHAQLASKNPNQESNGYREIALGICTTTTPTSSQRGLQPPDILTVWQTLYSLGTISVVIWCLEDSAETGFYIEN